MKIPRHLGTHLFSTISVKRNQIEVVCITFVHS